MRPLRHKYSSLLAAEQGLAYVEFALCLTMLLLLYLGSIEITRYILILQKLEKTVEEAAEVTTQSSPSDPVTSTQMAALMAAVPDMMNPYTFGSNGRLIVTDVSQPSSGSPVIKWQYCGGGTLVVNSKLGTTVGSAITANSLPNGLTLTSGEEIVVAEIFYTYVPLTSTPWSVMKGSTIYQTSVFTPRLGTLTGFSSSC